MVDHLVALQPNPQPPSPRRHHGAHHDHAQHQCQELAAQGGVRHCHGLVHRRLLRLRLLCAHRVRHRQLLHQEELGMGRQEGHGGPAAQGVWTQITHKHVCVCVGTINSLKNMCVRLPTLD